MDFPKLRLGMLDWVFVLLLVVGGLNWGLVGLLKYNLVETLFGVGTTVTMLVYDVVGVSALYVAVRALMGMGNSEK